MEQIQSHKRKLRAWDRHEGIFLKDKAIRLDGDGDPYEFDSQNNQWILNPHLVVNLFSGIVDSENKEIYEGDIVEFASDGEISLYKEVVLKNGKFDPAYLYAIAIEWRKFDAHPLMFGDMKIIGNIYENPELLREDD